MQGVVQKIADAAWRSANIVMPPLPALAVPTTLWCYLGGSLAQSQNMVAGAPPITVAAGTPYWQAPGNAVSVGPTSSVLPGAGYLETGVRDDSESFTLVTAARLNALSGIAQPIFVSDPVNASQGINLSVVVGGFRCQVYGNSINRTLAVANTTPFKLYVVSYDDTTFTQTLYNETDGGSDVFTGGAATRTLAATGTFKIGFDAQRPTGNANPSDVAFVGKISGAVSATQAGQIAANVRAHLALTGMMV